MPVSEQLVYENVSKAVNISVLGNLLFASAWKPQFEAYQALQDEWKEYVTLCQIQLQGFDQNVVLAILKSAKSAQEQTSAAEEFAALTLQWKTERGPSSSPSALAMHPAYQAIIGMGEKALPLIFSELQSGVDHWFWALRAISRENPVPPESRGNLEEMAKAWLKWGCENGYAPH